MRAIAGYAGTPAEIGRASQIQILVTPTGGLATDISDLVEEAEVTDTLDRSASTASVALARRRETWQDPFSGASPIAAGSRLEISMGERDGTLVKVFEGEIIRGGTSSEDPLARTILQAVGGYRRWWNKPVTTSEYVNADTDDIVEDLFTTWGSLGAGDFDLPGDGRIALLIQPLERPIMEIAFDLYEPANHIPWWNPETGRLSTLPCDVPIAADLVIPSTRRKLGLDWIAAEATRVSVLGGVLRGITRVEVGQWTTPHNILTAPRREGVRWATGSKMDWANPAYWAKADESFPHYGIYNAGPPPDYLWVEFLYGMAPIAGTGYRGPEGVRFIQNIPPWNGTPVSTVEIRQEDGCPWFFVIGKPHLERWDANEQIMLSHVKLRIDVQGWAPPPTGYLPEDYWQLILDNVNMPITFDLKSRQMVEDAREQLSAQAWNEAAIAAFGDTLKEIHNETLVIGPEPRTKVEAEAVRQAALLLVQQHQGLLELEGQDLRLLPGDCIQTEHPRDAYSILLWLQQVKQHWSSDAGKATTAGSGYVVGIVS